MSVKKSPRKNKRRRSTNRYPVYAALIIVVFACSAWFFYKILHLQPAVVWSEDKVTDVSEVTLPKDDAPHQAQIEWWYYNGHLSSESGKQYSFHDTVFLVNSMMNHMISHVFVYRPSNWQTLYRST